MHGRRPGAFRRLLVRWHGGAGLGGVWGPVGGRSQPVPDEAFLAGLAAGGVGRRAQPFAIPSQVIVAEAVEATQGPPASHDLVHRGIAVEAFAPQGRWNSPAGALIAVVLCPANLGARGFPTIKDLPPATLIRR